MKRLAACALLGALIAGCTSSPESTRSTPPPGPGDALGRWEADFRPSDHDTTGAPPLRPRVPGTDAASRDTLAGAPPPGGENELVPGFRVQIFSTTDIDEANQKKAEAEADFPAEWFYMVYDPPTYKIRGGNFIERYEAERFARQAIEKGFKDSWAVPEKVLRTPPSR
ncbi:MAG TPA: SPOR domain-containing protein [Bacteroidota bacterium]|nr:SPOR domain-containing protein [Bacteroidota bacterium]